MATPHRIDLVDLARVVYTAGKVFDGLRTGLLETEDFLRTGTTEGITSRADLALLEDLRDASTFIIDHTGHPIDADYVRSINSALTRSAAIHPGKLRTVDQQIGVNTRFGRHEPAALDGAQLEAIIRRAKSARTPQGQAVNLFVELARAQPFMDGNKRTALFAANGLLLGAGVNQLLVVPVDENDPSVADRFNDLLARAYVHDDMDAVKAMLNAQGLVRLDAHTHPQAEALYRRHPELRPAPGTPPTADAEAELDR